MTSPEDMTARFWRALKNDRTAMLGLVGADESHTRPMAAQIEGDEGGPIWFFSSVDTGLAKQVGQGSRRAILNFVSRSHDLFAAVHGDLERHDDRATIERLWNPFVAAWYEGGKDDPKIALLRFEPDDAQLWLNGSSLVAGIKALLGVDPKKDYQDQVARVSLDRPTEGRA